MSAILILPGMGGAYTSETFGVSINSVGADTFDLSRCAQFAVQLESTGTQGDGFQLQQTFNDGATWANFGSPVTGTSLFDESDGPFGLMRFSVAISAGSSIATVVGYSHDRA